MMTPKVIYTEFGKRLANLRKDHGLSQAELAARLHMPQSTYAGYETGKRKITLELIVEFSRFYSVSPTFLVTGKECTDGGGVIQATEMELIKKYRALTERGRKAIDIILSRPADSIVFVLSPEKCDSTKKSRKPGSS